ncbi:MAG TPA: thioredoxin domain-containing protein [Flavipsychrobacter sp.]|nr:thioredoxin domain-containing protein [Flavipsychrobacter sp.]
MPNRLIREQSPYLLQHANNPVDWYAWGDEPFERAKMENKPVLISIGYAACHWCHVMERESFEDETTAAYMNEHFINIKVDREEHPDVDHMYMDAVQAISGSGGWPLNVFVTPERIPFYGGTYYPPRPAYNRPSWVQLLNRISELWEKQKDDVTAQAKQMIQYLQQASKIATNKEATTWDINTCRKTADTLLNHADKEFGGFGIAPKFPGTMAINFLLEHYHFTKYEPALKQALLSLDAMIKGGIYDQIGGGFARYATDAKWLVPHFEKMLYDNALLISALCDGYSITKNPIYKKIIEETITFTERELKDPTGGYYSALDADSEGEEGKYYTWTWEEWINALGENDKIAAAYFGINKEGNWEHTNILHVAKSVEEIADEENISKEEINQHIEKVKQKLFAKRQKRVRPLTDDKSLLSWNALMNIALSKSAIVLQREEYLELAAKHMQWMLLQFRKENELMHTWKNGIAKINANLDDYAYLIQALLQLGSATDDNTWIQQANELAQMVENDFLHEEGSFFYYTSDKQTDIPVRKVDMYDGAIPSANAMMAHNLLLLGQCMERSEWIERAAYMVQQMAANALRYTSSFGYWSLLLQRYAVGIKLVIAAGKAASDKSDLLKKHFIPQCFLLTSKKEISELPILEAKFFNNEILIFVCTQQACLKPVSNIDEALHLINQ